MARNQKDIVEGYREVLGAELKKHGRSQSGLARHLGIDQSAVNRMLSGGRRIRLEEQVQIEDYLHSTDPNGHFKILERLPLGATGNDALSAFPDLEQTVRSRRFNAREDGQGLVDLNNDYPLVMICGSMVERDLNSLVMSLQAKASEASQPSVPNSLTEKIAIAEHAGRIEGRQAATLLAICAIRDAFVRSQVPMSLSDPAVFPIVEKIVTPGYVWSVDQANTEPQTLRYLYLMGVLAIRHRLTASDPAQTTAMMMEAAFEAWSKLSDEK